MTKVRLGKKDKGKDETEEWESVWILAMKWKWGLFFKNQHRLVLKRGDLILIILALDIFVPCFDDDLAMNCGTSNFDSNGLWRTKIYVSKNSWLVFIHIYTFFLTFGVEKNNNIQILHGMVAIFLN